MCGGMSTKVVQEPEAQVVCSVVASKSPRDPRGTVPRPEPGIVLVRTFRSTCKIMHSYGSVCFAHSGEGQVCLSGGQTQGYMSRRVREQGVLIVLYLGLFRSVIIA